MSEGWQDPLRLAFARWLAAVQKIGIPPKRELSWEADWLFEALCPSSQPPTAQSPPLSLRVVANADVAEVEALARRLERSIVEGAS